MIPDTIADEYPLRLSTGEVIQVAELDDERSPALGIEEVRTLVRGLLIQCTHVNRQSMEDAKKGYDRDFKQALRSMSEGCMIKAEPAVCRLLNDCAMYRREKCTLHNISTVHPLPICWEFSPVSGGKVNDEIRKAAIDLGTVIGDAWRRGFLVVVVTN